MPAYATDEAKINTLAVNAVHRRTEHGEYQFNIDNYGVMLTAFPEGAWPEDIKEYEYLRDLKADDKIPDVRIEIVRKVPEEFLEKVSEYIERDHIKLRLAVEKMEQKKVQRYYDAMVSQINPAILETKLADAVEFLTAQAEAQAQARAK